MEGFGWIGTLIIGGLAGWISGRAMRARMGSIASLLVGVAGAVLLNFALIRLTGETYGGFFGQLGIAAGGAVVLTFLLRTVRL